MGYIADLYRKAAFDGMYRRELLPENLRMFEMDIYVAEFRKFRSLLETTAFNIVGKAFGDNVSNFASKALDLIRNEGDYFEKNVSFIKYNCHMCEFDFSKTFAGGDKLNVHTPDMATNKFEIKVGWFMEQNSYTFHDIMTKDNWSKYDLTRKDWSKKRSLTLNGMLGAVTALIGASKDIYGNATGLVKDVGAGLSGIGKGIASGIQNFGKRG